MSTTRMRRIVLVAAIMIALAFAFAAAMSAASRPAAQAVAAADEPRYIVSDFGGYVAVFENGMKTPSFVTDTRIDSLPLADREMLAGGIEVYSEDELSLLLEDYGT